MGPAYLAAILLALGFGMSLGYEHGHAVGYEAGTGAVSAYLVTRELKGNRVQSKKPASISAAGSTP